MNANRPMSEHEGALFDAVLALAATLLELGADAQKLQARLSEARDAADALGNRHGAATLDFLLSSLFPSSPPPKSPLRLV
jgi:hypothetical protein